MPKITIFCMYSGSEYCPSDTSNREKKQLVMEIVMTLMAVDLPPNSGWHGVRTATKKIWDRKIQAYLTLSSAIYKYESTFDKQESTLNFTDTLPTCTVLNMCHYNMISRSITFLIQVWEVCKGCLCSVTGKWNSKDIKELENVESCSVS